MAVSSYEGARSTGTARLVLDLKRDPEGQHVLLVEDVADTGLTLARLHKILSARNVASLKTCALLDKPSGRRVPLQLDYVGFQLPPGFVVGYGLDFEERYRHLPYIGLLKRSVYEGKARHT
jgi:hypoxanthine phosphoribosyltransferase